MHEQILIVYIRKVAHVEKLPGKLEGDGFICRKAIAESCIVTESDHFFEQICYNQELVWVKY